MSKIQPVIKWSGSKRSQTEHILKFFPNGYDTYYEPFLGGGSMMYASHPQKGVCSDICEPLIDLWKEIQENPERLSEEYRKRWEKLQRQGQDVYYEIRSDFNESHSPYDFLFLSRTCTNGLIRFNQKGEFNNSFHHTRPGISPEKLKKIIFEWSDNIQNIRFLNGDYKETTKDAKDGDLVYLDPPYFHTKGMYYGKIDFDEFLCFLDDLNRKGVKFMLSYDGVRGESDYRVEIPKELYKRHEMIPSGISSFQRIVNRRKQMVYESLYLNF